MTPPLITVLMPVYNGEKYLKESIESILNQTYCDFEFLIINDGSTDSSEAIVREYAEKDKRIRYVENKTNLGLVSTLNKGLKLAKGKYVARMDADDIAYSDRFSKQIELMERRLEVSICGTSFQSIGARHAKHVYPQEHEAIKAGLLFGSCICHPSVLMRTDFILENHISYIADTFPAEDYKIWVKSARLGKLYNLPDILLKYREHDTQISTENKHWQKEQTDKIRLEMLELLSAEFNENEKRYHLDIFVPGTLNNRNDIKQFKAWIKCLSAENEKHKNFDVGSLREKLRAHLAASLLKYVQYLYFKDQQYSLSRFTKYLFSGMMFRVPVKQNLRFLYRSLKA